MDVDSRSSGKRTARDALARKEGRRLKFPPRVREKQREQTHKQNRGAIHVASETNETERRKTREKNLMEQKTQFFI